MDGFYWIIPKVLAGSRRPGGRRDDAVQLDEELAWLRTQDIGAILSLTEVPVDEISLARHGFETLHLPIVDMTAPDSEQIAEALAFIDAQTARGRAVLVHCLAGQGRTGTILAAYLIRSGHSPEKAIAELRLVCPHAVENRLQEQALAEYANRRDWLT